MSSCLKHDWYSDSSTLPWCPRCLDENASRPSEPGVALGVRVDVFKFSLAMEAALKKHDKERGERGWISSPDPVTWFLSRLKEEVEELQEAMDNIDVKLTKKECADVANFAMMIYSILADRERSP